MSNSAAGLSVTGVSAGEPRSVNPSQPLNKGLSAASRAAVVPQPALASSNAPSTKAATAGTSASKAKTTAASRSSRKAESKDDEEEDDGGEDIIPMKVPLSESDEDDEAPSSAAAVVSPSQSATGVREKTFLSEVDMEALKPQSFTAPSASSSSSSSSSGPSKRQAEEKALAAAEASASYRPRMDWSTESASDRSGSGSATEVFCCTWSPDAKFLATGCGDGSIRVFNTSTGRIAYMLRSSAAAPLGAAPSAVSAGGLDLSLPVTCIRFRPEAHGSNSRGVLLATSADGSVSHWHMPSQTCLYSQVEQQQDTKDAQVYSCDYSPEGDSFATGGRDGVVRLYDESTKTLVSSLHSGRDRGTTGHSNRVYSLKFNTRDPNMLVSGGWDNTIQVWDLRAGHSVRSMYGPHICGDGLDLAPGAGSGSGSVILTASWRPQEALQRWDLAAGKLIDTIPFAAGPGGLGADRPELLYAAAFAPGSDGSRFAAGGCGTNETKVFSSEGGAGAAGAAAGAGATKPKVLERVSAGNGGVYCLGFSPNGKRIAMGGGGAAVTVVDLA